MLSLPSPLSFRLRSTIAARMLLGSLFAAATLAPASAQAGDERYQLRISGQEIPAGQSGQVKLELTADEPWHMNTDFPTSVKISPVAGVAFDQATLKRGDARVLSEHKIVFIFDVSPQRSGEYRMPGKIKFAICKNDSCSPASARFNLRIQSRASKTAETAAPAPKQVESAQPKAKRERRARRPRRKGKKSGAFRPAAPLARPSVSLDERSPLALRYLDQWMLDPIWGPGMSQRLLHLLQN